MRKMLICTLPLLALAACGSSVKFGDADENSSESNVHIAMNDDKVAVDAPGFNAKLALPNLNLGSHLDLDGIKVAPDTKVTVMDVTANDKRGADDEGKVQIGFTNPAAPAAILDHYARATVDAGYGDVSRTGSALTAHKGQKSFALNIAPEGSGSHGTIIISGKD